MRPILIAMILVSALAWLTDNEAARETAVRAAAASRASTESDPGVAYNSGAALADRAPAGQR